MSTEESRWSKSKPKNCCDSEGGITSLEESSFGAKSHRQQNGFMQRETLEFFSEQGSFKIRVGCSYIENDGRIISLFRALNMTREILESVMLIVLSPILLYPSKNK